MKQLENNIFFWQKLDTLFLSSTCHIDRPKGSAHYKFSNIIYPVDYGYLSDTTSGDQAPIDIFIGTKPDKKVDAIAISADILKRDLECKVLAGCTDEEKQEILELLNQTEFQKAILVQRGMEAPSWGSSD